MDKSPETAGEKRNVGDVSIFPVNLCLKIAVGTETGINNITHLIKTIL